MRCAEPAVGDAGDEAFDETFDETLAVVAPRSTAAGVAVAEVED